MVVACNGVPPVDPVQREVLLVQLDQRLLEVLGVHLAQFPGERVGVVLEGTRERVGRDLEDRVRRREQVRREGEGDDRRRQCGIVRSRREPERAEERLVAEEEGEAQDREADLQQGTAEKVNDVVALPVTQFMSCEGKESGLCSFASGVG